MSHLPAAPASNFIELRAPKVLPNRIDPRHSGALAQG